MSGLKRGQGKSGLREKEERKEGKHEGRKEERERDRKEERKKQKLEIVSSSRTLNILHIPRSAALNRIP